MAVAVVGCSTRSTQRVDAGGAEPIASVPTTVATPSSDALSTAIYWTRPYGDPRPVSVVGYDDPGDGSRPFVLYGSITNRGAGAVANPVVEVSGTDATGTMTSFGQARVLDPHGADLAILDPGTTADVLFVLDDPESAGRLDALAPVLVGETR